MLSKSAAVRKLGERTGFEWRSREVSRVESLSDAVFGLAVTLLIVSAEVPKTYEELLSSLRLFVPFAFSFVILMSIWYQHYIFHRRYGLEDLASTIYTMALLFLVLFYTYPLKFMFMVDLGTRGYELQSAQELAGLFTIYGVGFIAIYVLFFFMYRHAYRKREELNLTEVEVWDTRHSMREILMMGSVGCLSVAVANLLPGDLVILAGPAYALLGLISWLHGSWSNKRRAAIFVRLEAAAEEPEPALNV